MRRAWRSWSACWATTWRVWAERLTATVEVSRNYRSFSGLTDGMDGAVRFIYRTEAVEKAE